MGQTRAALARRLLVAISWTLATALAATIAWGAVSRLGREGSATPPSTLTQSDVRVELAQSPRSAATPTSAVNEKPTAQEPTPSTSTPGGNRRGRGGAGRASALTADLLHRTAFAVGRWTVDDGRRLTPRRRARNPRRRSTPAPKRISKSWQLTGGSVGVSCKGPDIYLDFATPRDGWEMEIEESGPDTVSVSFHRDDHESRFSGHCENGSPVGQTHEGGDDGGSGGSGHE